MRTEERKECSITVTRRLFVFVCLVLCTGYPLWGEAAPSQAASGGRWIDVQSVGAKGDGTTDDTQAIFNAVGGAMETGKTLYFPKGVYLVERPIRITAYGLTIRGDGAQHSVIRAAAEMDRLLYLRGSGIVVSGLMLDANHMAVYAIHAFHLNEQDSRLEFLRVVQARSHGFFLDHSQLLEVSNVISQMNGGDGFYITDCNGTEIRHCRAIENAGRGFLVTATDYSGGCYLLQCDAEMNGMEGLLIAATGGTPTIVTNMWCETNNPTGGARGEYSEKGETAPNLCDGVRIASRAVVMSGCRISTRADSPARPKFAIHLAADALLALGDVSGQFQVGERVTGTKSGASGVVDAWQADPLFSEEFPIPPPYVRWLDRPKKLVLREVTGSFENDETVTGATSKARASVTSSSEVSPDNCTIANNWIARETTGSPVDAVRVDVGCSDNVVGPNYRMWGSTSPASIDYEK